METMNTSTYQPQVSIRTINHLFLRGARPLFSLFDENFKLLWGSAGLDFTDIGIPLDLSDKNYSDVLMSFGIVRNEVDKIEANIKSLQGSKGTPYSVELRTKKNIYALMYFKREDGLIQSTLSDITEMRNIGKQEGKYIINAIKNELHDSIKSLIELGDKIESDKGSNAGEVKRITEDFKSIIRRIIIGIDHIVKIYDRFYRSNHSQEFDEFRRNLHRYPNLDKELQYAESFIDKALPIFLIAPECSTKEIFILNHKTKKRFSNWFKCFKTLSGYGDITDSGLIHMGKDLSSGSRQLLNIFNETKDSGYYCTIAGKNYYVISKPTLTKFGRQATLLPVDKSTSEGVAMGLKSRLLGMEYQLNGNPDSYSDPADNFHKAYLEFKSMLNDLGMLKIDENGGAILL